jgi:hypothetical protein
MKRNFPKEKTMKTLFSIAIAGFCVLVAGCATSSQVQEMIDASQRDYLEKSAEYDSSIDVLEKSAITALEQNKEQAGTLTALQQQQKDTLSQFKVMQGNAEAAKVMSAANTMKGAGLETAVTENKQELDESIAKLVAADELYREVLSEHFQMMADSAHAALVALKAEEPYEEVPETRNNPMDLAEPIEIIAPDTSSQ